MSEYGSGIPMTKAFQYDKERLEHALNNELICGETENGFEYAPCSKEEADAYIKEVFDNAVYECLEATASANTLDKILREHCNYPESETFQLYMKYIEAEKMKLHKEYPFPQGDDPASSRA